MMLDKGFVERVKRDLSPLFLPYEYRIPIEWNHSGVIAFHSRNDGTCQTVVIHMGRCVVKIAKKKQQGRELIYERTLWMSERIK